MGIETKKKNIMSLISSISDEKLIDEIEAKIVHLVPKLKNDDLQKYQTKIVDIFDLDQLKKDQNYVSPNLSDIEKLIAEADIQEPIDELLKMI